jgi:hypothetical protein
MHAYKRDRRRRILCSHNECIELENDTQNVLLDSTAGYHRYIHTHTQLRACAGKHTHAVTFSYAIGDGIQEMNDAAKTAEKQAEEAIESPAVLW